MANAKLLCRLTALMLLFLALGSAALAEEDSDGIVYVEPTYPENAAQWDADHPEILEPDMLRAHAAILVEMDSGTVIFEKNADQIMFPASTTKIMTTLLAVQFGNLDDVVEISANAVNIPSDSSYIGLREGERLTLRDLVYGTFVRSGNDGSIAIAEHISGSEAAFVDLMNQTAAMLGCSENTHFANAHGYHNPNHYTTAADMAIIARAAMQVDAFRDVASTYVYTIPATNQQAARNVQADSINFLDPTAGKESNPYYYEGGIAGKTGYTDAAGYCFVALAERGGVELLSVVFYSSVYGRWTDTRRLMDYGFEQYVSTDPISIYNEDPRYIDIMGFALDDYYSETEKYGTVRLGIRPVDEDTDVRIVGTVDEIETMKNNFSSISHVNWTREFRAPINEGDVMGILTFYPRDGGTVEYELYATRSVAAREDGPPTLEQIQAYTLADDNPFPRFSAEYVAVPGAFLFVLVLIIRRLLALGKRRRKREGRVPEPQSRTYR